MPQSPCEPYHPNMVTSWHAIVPTYLGFVRGIHATDGLPSYKEPVRRSFDASLSAWSNCQVSGDLRRAAFSLFSPTVFMWLKTPFSEMGPEYVLFQFSLHAQTNATTRSRGQLYDSKISKRHLFPIQIIFSSFRDISNSMSDISN